MRFSRNTKVILTQFHGEKRKTPHESSIRNTTKIKNVHPLQISVIYALEQTHKHHIYRPLDSNTCGLFSAQFLCTRFATENKISVYASTLSFVRKKTDMKQSRIRNMGLKCQKITLCRGYLCTRSFSTILL